MSFKRQQQLHQKQRSKLQGIEEVITTITIIIIILFVIVISIIIGTVIIIIFIATIIIKTLLYYCQFIQVSKHSSQYIRGICS